MMSLGSWLKFNRQKLEISIEQANDETGIKAAYLLAIENDDYELLPSEQIYVKSFIRSYADFLGLSGEEAVAYYLGESEPPQISALDRMIEPKVVEPKVVEPKVVEPKVVEPKVVEPKVVEPKVVEPKVVEPKVVEPKVVEPKVVEPKVSNAHANVKGNTKKNARVDKHKNKKKQISTKLANTDDLIETKLFEEIHVVAKTSKIVTEDEFANNDVLVNSIIMSDLAKDKTKEVTINNDRRDILENEIFTISTAERVAAARRKSDRVWIIIFIIIVALIATGAYHIYGKLSKTENDVSVGTVETVSGSKNITVAEQKNDSKSTDGNSNTATEQKADSSKSNQLKIEIKAINDCWVEAVVDGMVEYSDTLVKGKAITFKGKIIVITYGDCAAVNVMRNGSLIAKPGSGGVGEVYTETYKNQ